VQLLATQFGVSPSIITNALNSSTLCSGVTTPVSVVPVSDASHIFTVASDGVPVSSNPIWNACIRHESIIVAGDQPLSCQRYHRGNTWEQPDTHVAFNWSDRVGKNIEFVGTNDKFLVLPIGQ
jgi:hypothetical protein